MNKKDQVQFLLLLSSCYCLTKEIPPTKANVLDTIQDNEWAYFSQHDLEIKHNRNELVWRNTYAFERKHLADAGYFEATSKNNWKITELGKAYLIELFRQCTTSVLDIITSKAICDCASLCHL